MPRSSLGRVFFSLALCAALTATSAAKAQPDRPERLYGRLDPFLPLRLAGHVALTWEGNMGIGGRADFPLVTGTFRYSQRDELAVSVGGDVTFIALDGSQRTEVFPSAALQWSLGVSDRFFFYPELGLVAHIIRSEWDGFYPNIGFGARYYLRRSFSLQARLGWPLALTAGVSF